VLIEISAAPFGEFLRGTGKTPLLYAHCSPHNSVSLWY